LLLVDKPAGMTSHDVVQHVRRIYGERSIGHLGTLDPFATGLLVLLLGRATRLATFIDAEPKVYEATIKFGEETDTDDATGTVIRTASPPREADVLSAVKSLTGTIAQVPPAYSAKSVDGTRAYDAARRGEPLDLAAANVTVHGWELGKFTGDSLSGSEAVEWGLAIEAPPPDQLDERTEILVRRIAKVPLNQLMMMKLLVNQETASRGLYATQVLGTVFDGITRHTSEGYAFQQRAAKAGFKQAVRERDEPFGDAGPSTFKG